MALTELLLRLAIAFMTLLVLARLMGRKEISQMTFFNFISAISIGTIGASLAIDATLAIRNGIIALVAWRIFTIVLGFLDIKSIQARKVINGEPLIVVREGKIMEGALRKAGSTQILCKHCSVTKIYFRSLTLNLQFLKRMDCSPS